MASAAAAAATAVPRIAVVGGGIAGTLCSLVLKNRGLHPVLIDAGSSGVGGRLRNGGAQFLRASSSNGSRLVPVINMLVQEGLLQEWKGRFGMLGSSGGGFLPAEIVAQNQQSSGGSGSIMGLQKAHNDELLNSDEDAAFPSAATDAGDFCQFVEGSAAPTYVGVPSMTQLCPEIVKMAGIQQINDARLVAASPQKEGGWSLLLENGAAPETYDGLVLATHDPSLASGAVRSIADAESQACGYGSIQDAMDAPSASSQDDSSLVIQRLMEISGSLQRVRDNDKLPVYSVSLTYPHGFSERLPFDAVSIPGSQLVQFFVREASKPGLKDNAAGEIWTVVTTSKLAASVLEREDLGGDEKKDAILTATTKEISHLLSKYFDQGTSVPDPLQVYVKRWGAAFCGKGLQLKEDSIFLAPWRLSICGDFVRGLSVYSNPLEAAALSGLEAGERMSSLWTQT